MVDIISSSCWLKPAYLAMQLSQMIVQAVNPNESSLLQLPHFNNQLVEVFKKNNVEDIGDFMNMDDNHRKSLLKISNEKIAEMAEFCNHYPTVNLEFKVKQKNEIHEGENIRIEVEITREGDQFSEFVFAPYFPKVNINKYFFLFNNLKFF